jgi:uncharacterized protein (TIGR03067 family)
MYRFLSLAILLVFAPVGLADDATDQEIKALQGQWVWVRHEAGGIEMAPDPGDQPVIKIEGTKWSLRNNKTGTFNEIGTFKLDVATTPRCVDLVSTQKENQGQKNEAIYKLDKDTLTVVVNLNADDKSRPMEFKTEGKPGLLLVVFQRKE